MPLPPERRKRLHINATESSLSGYELDTTAASIIERMQDLIKTHGPYVYLDWDPSYHYPYDESPTPTFWVKVSRLETDEEMAKRISQEEAHYNDFERREREQYEKLKSKFGDK